MKKILFIPLALTIAGSCSLFQLESKNETTAYIDLGSKKASRSTELGTAKKAKKKMKKEYDIRLMDPAIKQKWGLALTD